MQLVKNQQYGTLEVDFYVNKSRDIFINIDQLARGFGYKSRKGIENLMARQPYLYEKKFSATYKLRVVEGDRTLTRTIRVFNKRGITEIGMLSRTKQGQGFRNWLFDYMEELERENYYFRLQRDHEKLYHSQLTDAIAGWVYKNQHSYSNINSLLCQVVTGLIPRQLRAQHGASKEVPTLDLMTAEQVAQYRQKEVQAIICLQQQQTYSEIKANLLAA
ncbi:MULTISPECIES: hypothetical protein [Aerococcus]|uniref:hypothetical protein n=1 Tax=Aerococcus TaxID=1375 RepID=UPI0017851C6F|nr:hypothetical protein [Aerococcus urinae]MDK6689722.1 hypothetical protein [Aerococcus urinae]